MELGEGGKRKKIHVNQKEEEQMGNEDTSNRRRDGDGRSSDKNKRGGLT